MFINDLWCSWVQPISGDFIRIIKIVLNKAPTHINAISDLLSHVSNISTILLAIEIECSPFLKANKYIHYLNYARRTFIYPINSPLLLESDTEL